MRVLTSKFRVSCPATRSSRKKVKELRQCIKNTKKAKIIEEEKKIRRNGIFIVKNSLEGVSVCVKEFIVKISLVGLPPLGHNVSDSTRALGKISAAR